MKVAKCREYILCFKLDLQFEPLYFFDFWNLKLLLQKPHFDEFSIWCFINSLVYYLDSCDTRGNFTR